LDKAQEVVPGVLIERGVRHERGGGARHLRRFSGGRRTRGTALPPKGIPSSRRSGIWTTPSSFSSDATPALLLSPPPPDAPRAASKAVLAAFPEIGFVIENHCRLTRYSPHARSSSSSLCRGEDRQLSREG